MKSAYNFRKKPLEYALEHVVSAKARVFSATRKTVQKFLWRYDSKGISGLSDCSRALKRCASLLSSELGEEIVEICRRPYLVAYRIKHKNRLICREGAIYQLFKAHDLIRQGVRKYRRKPDLRRVKDKLKPFELVQVDVKELNAIIPTFCRRDFLVKTTL